jgi:hypothetical protein
MRFSGFLKFLSLFLALGLVPAWAEGDNLSIANSRSARPGTVNYVEGQSRATIKPWTRNPLGRPR